VHEGIIEKLYQEYTMHGFISEDHIFDVLEENGISLFDVEYICDHLLSKGVIIRDDATVDDDEEECDRSNIDYEEVFREVLEIDDTFTDFIEYIRGIKPPQHREWINLMPQVKLNNAYARNRIFEMYMKVAVRFALIHAKKYHLPLDETIQNAMMGLYISIDKYENARQENFASYFPLWVRQYIMRAAQTRNPSVYFPTYVKEKLFAIYDNMEDYFGEVEYRTKPGIELLQSIATELECNLDEARQLFDYLVPFGSIEELLEDENNELLFSDDGVGHENMVSSVESGLDGSVLYEKLATLTPREEEVLRLRYGIGHKRAYTLEEVGNEFCVTRERVRQIEAKAFRKIRHRYGMKDKDEN
jgi:RNA polymerase primary sigma factor